MRLHGIPQQAPLGTSLLLECLGGIGGPVGACAVAASLPGPPPEAGWAIPLASLLLTPAPPLLSGLRCWAQISESMETAKEAGNPAGGAGLCGAWGGGGEQPLPG